MKKIVFVFSFLLTISIQINAQWSWQNPLPQGNDLLDIQSINSNIGFACGKHGTFLKTTNGINWVLVQFPSQDDLIKLYFSNSSVGWVAGKRDSVVHLYKTTDSGESWTELVSSNGNLISFFFINDSLGWLSIDGNLFRSYDGGMIWNQISTLQWIHDIFFSDSLHGCLACGDSIPNSSRIYYTSNGGNNWQFSTLNFDLMTKMNFVNPSDGWLIGNALPLNGSINHIWNSTNAGRTWQEQFTYYGYDVFSDLDFINDSIGWVLSDYGNFFKTTNGGTSWEEISQSFYLNSLTPVNESNLWSCGKYGVNYISNDGGTTWEKNYGGELSYGSQELFFLNENMGFVGGHNLLLKTQDAGDQWEKINIIVPGRTSYYVRALSFSDQMRGWVGLESVGNWGGFFRTTDGGNTWVSQVDSIPRVWDISFINDSLGWFVSGSKIYNTTNGGNTWAIEADILDISEFNSMQFTSQDRGWAGGYIGLYKTEDGGNSWTEIFPLGNDIYPQRIFFLNDLEGWIITYGSEIFKTTDGGTSRIDQSISTPQDFIYSDIYFVDSNTGWIVGENYSFGSIVLHTINGGSDWEIIDFPTSQPLSRVLFRNKNIGWIIAYSGAILHTTNGGVTFIEDENNNFTKPKDFLLQQNYPNPFNPSTSIQYAISSRQFVTLKVYDLLGREVATLVNEEKPAGAYNVQFTMNNVQLSSGIYLYRLQAGDYVESKKMILLK